jgi:hypothetical protein
MNGEARLSIHAVPLNLFTPDWPPEGIPPVLISRHRNCISLWHSQKYVCVFMHVLHKIHIRFMQLALKQIQIWFSPVVDQNDLYFVVQWYIVIVQQILANVNSNRFYDCSFSFQLNLVQNSCTFYTVFCSNVHINLAILAWKGPQKLDKGQWCINVPITLQQVLHNTHSREHDCASTWQCHSQAFPIKHANHGEQVVPATQYSGWTQFYSLCSNYDVFLLEALAIFAQFIHLCGIKITLNFIANTV